MENVFNKLVKFSVLSKYITGGTTSLRKNNIPKVHEWKVNLLKSKILDWQEDVEEL